jgi:hypothetical protein
MQLLEVTKFEFATIEDEAHDLNFSVSVFNKNSAK